MLYFLFVSSFIASGVLKLMMSLGQVGELQRAPTFKTVLRGVPDVQSPLFQVQLEVFYVLSVSVYLLVLYQSVILCCIQILLCIVRYWKIRDMVYSDMYQTILRSCNLCAKGQTEVSCILSSLFRPYVPSLRRAGSWLLIARLKGPLSYLV